MAIAVVASIGALRSFPAPPPPVCPVSADPDTAYAARLEPGPRSGRHTYQVYVFVGGLPVGDAQFCLRAAMTGMPEMNVDTGPLDLRHARRVQIKFEMAGPWAGAIMLVRHNKQSLSVPLYLNVE